jgi:hypothetical protein
MRLGHLILAVVLIPLPGRADDGAASVAAGGLVLMKREPRITMAKEVLRISPRKVAVEYDFRNDSEQDITTTVAFPVPSYRFGEDETVAGDPAFKDFELFVDGQPKRFVVQVRALIDNRDITTAFAGSGIDIASFGHFDEKSADYTQPVPDYVRASVATRKRLTALRAFDDGVPNWRVKKLYYWTQTFPAHGTVHIKHSYSPVFGGANSVRYGLEAEKEAAAKGSDLAVAANEVDSSCIMPSLKDSLLKLSERNDMSVPFNYVDFILTTANTWKTPIDDFTLIVDRPTADKLIAKHLKSPQRNKVLVSFCWNGPIEHPDPTRFVAHATNFVPTKELRVGFVYVDHVDPE